MPKRTADHDTQAVLLAEVTKAAYTKQMEDEANFAPRTDPRFDFGGFMKTLFHGVSDLFEKVKHGLSANRVWELQQWRREEKARKELEKDAPEEEEAEETTSEQDDDTPAVEHDVDHRSPNPVEASSERASNTGRRDFRAAVGDPYSEGPDVSQDQDRELVYTGADPGITNPSQ